MLDRDGIKNLFAKSLNINGRINRADHFLRKFFLLLAQIGITIIAIIIIGFVAKSLGKPPQMGMSLIVDFFYILLFFTYAYIFGLLWNVVTVLRLHDLNLDGRWCIFNFVIFIPMLLFLFRVIVPQPGEYPVSYSLPIAIFIIFNIVLLFAGGSAEENYYGQPPAYDKDRLPSPYAGRNKKPASAGVSAKTGIIRNASRTTPKHKTVQSAARHAQPSAGGGGTVMRVVDKNYLKHSERYQPKTGRKQ